MNATSSLIVTGRRVVTPAGIRPAAILVEAGRIEEVLPLEAVERNDVGGESALSRYDAGDDIVLPGLVDTHVHVNEPGRTEWEGFLSASDAAVAGGVTSLVDMPLNCSPVTCSPGALEAKREAAAGKSRVDYGFWGGVIPGNAGQLETLAEAGVLGFKCFLVDSGLAEFPPLTPSDLRVAMEILAPLELPLLAHAELPGPIAAVAGGLPKSSRRHDDWLASRPPEAEVEAVRLLLDLSVATGCRIHVVHVSAAECLPLIESAKRGGVRVTAETCPHYLAFTAEDVPSGATIFKCAPPIRGAENRELLWKGLAAGTLDLVASDHSPCPPIQRALETGDFFEAWGGVASLQMGVAAVWTEAADRGFEVDRLASWMSAGPARLAGLEHRKGAIAPGRDADLVIFDPEAEFVVRTDDLLDRHRLTPYEGRCLRGVVRRTWVRGRLAFDDGHPKGETAGIELARE